MDLKGTRQKTGDKKLRQRSGAYPYELAYRLICMFSVMGDTVLDPFVGTGTTLSAAVATARHSVGYELDKSLQPLIRSGFGQAVEQAHRRIGERFDGHLKFVRDRQAAGGAIKYTNRAYGFPVMTRQETELIVPMPKTVNETAQNHFSVSYMIPVFSATGEPAAVPAKTRPERTGQMQLFD
jgi:hypothetical protein